MKSRTFSCFCLQVVLLYASTYVLVSLSIDRYHAIVYPMKFLQGGKVAQSSAILKKSSLGEGRVVFTNIILLVMVFFLPISSSLLSFYFMGLIVKMM